MSGILAEIQRKQLIQDWAKYTAQRLQNSIQKKKIGVSGSLAYSVLYKVMSAAGGEIGSVQHSFNYYGKFVDMGVGRGQKIESVKGNGDIIALGGSVKRKPKKWFSRIYYTEVLTLSSLLAAKYGEDSANIIKEALTTDFK